MNNLLIYVIVSSLVKTEQFNINIIKLNKWILKVKAKPQKLFELFVGNIVVISMICLLILYKNKWVNAILPSIGFVTLTIYSKLIGLKPIESRNINWEKEIKLKTLLIWSVWIHYFQIDVQFSGWTLEMLSPMYLASPSSMYLGLSGCGASLTIFGDN